MGFGLMYVLWKNRGPLYKALVTTTIGVLLFALLIYVTILTEGIAIVIFFGMAIFAAVVALLYDHFS